MIVYEIMAEMGSDYYATLKEAREALPTYGSPAPTIERLTLAKLPPQKLAVRLLNHEGFVAKRGPVA